MLFEQVFQIKLVLFQGGCLMTTVRFVHVEDFSVSQGDLFLDGTVYFLHSRA